MADIRSLLRSELASRRGSPQTGTNTTNRVTKKRKVDPSDGLTRKKVRHTNPEQLLASAQIQPPSTQAIAEEVEDVESPAQDITTPEVPADAVISQETIDTISQQPRITATISSEAPVNAQDIDEDEWAAFERDVVAPTRVPYRPAAVTAAATISAAPMSTQELAALQEKENETMRRNREAEMEGEREDAARFMEEEFDEMEQLEERVRRLKQKREQLRMKRALESGESFQTEEPPSALPSASEEAQTEVNGTIDNKNDEDDDEDDDIDDDWDNWRFR